MPRYWTLSVITIRGPSPIPIRASLRPTSLLGQLLDRGAGDRHPFVEREGVILADVRRREKGLQAALGQGGDVLAEVVVLDISVG